MTFHGVAPVLLGLKSGRARPVDAYYQSAMRRKYAEIMELLATKSV
jgi:hypothetical protein